MGTEVTPSIPSRSVRSIGAPLTACRCRRKEARSGAISLVALESATGGRGLTHGSGLQTAEEEHSQL